jgi:ribosomal protein S18 acetylase RimI-like enzyme
VLLRREGEALAASVMVGCDGHRGWVYYLAVAPERRREGLGRAMMAAAEAWLRDRGAPKLQLMVRDDNEAALGFYGALGLERQHVVTLGRFLT